jgi:hypothetical protein
MGASFNGIADGHLNGIPERGAGSRGRRASHVKRKPDDSVDQRLCAENNREGEALGVFRRGFGGVDHDAQIVGGDDERVAVQRDATEVGMVDDLAPAEVLVRLRGAGFPQLDEARAPCREVVYPPRPNSSTPRHRPC